MAEQLLFDKLAYIDRLRKGGLDEALARTHAEAMHEALRESVATKSDLAELRNATKSDLAELRLAIKADLHAMRADIIQWTVGAMIAMTAVFGVIVKLL